MACECPICGSIHDTYSGVAMHMVKKQDDEHSNYESIDAALDHLSEVGLIGVGGSGEGMVVDTSTDGGSDKSDEEPDTSNPLMGDGEPNVPEPEAECCKNPQLTPAEGVYRLENGEAIRAEGSDDYCTACGALVEADGRVLR